MKTYKIIAGVFLSLTMLNSCSNDLTKDKVKIIAQKCLDNNPIEGNITFKSGTYSFQELNNKGEDYLKKLVSLQESGYVKLEQLSETQKLKVSLTEKSKNLVQSTRAKRKDTVYKINSFKYYVKEVLNITSLDNGDLKKVKIHYQKKTSPFFVFDKNQEINKERESVYKYENNEWAGCK